MTPSRSRRNTMRRSSLAALSLAALTSLAAVPQAGAANDCVRYTLTGTLVAYSAPTADAPGTATIAVTQGYRAGKPFTGETMTFTLGAATRVHGGVDAPQAGDRARIEVHAKAGLGCDELEGVTPSLV